MVQYDGQYEVARAATGVRCGNHPHEQVRHADAESVRECYRLAADLEAQERAEIEAERAYERHLEDAGYWEARAQEDWEARMGVIPFDVAMAMAAAA